MTHRTSFILPSLHIFKATHPSIHQPFMHPFIHTSTIHPSINQPYIHLFIHPFKQPSRRQTHQLTPLMFSGITTLTSKSSIHPFIHPSIHLSIHLSIHSSIHPSIHLSIHSSIHPSSNPFIQPCILLSTSPLSYCS